ncbi:MAG: dUTP diphosphatase [Bacteroidota bacterium]|jgi:dUTP pyrophosphatase
MNIPIQILDHARDLPLPFYATEGSAGMDIHAAVSEPLTLNAGKVAMVPTGLCVAIPHGFEIQVRSRSGLAAKNGVFALNSPGTIDSDYRGEIKVILANFSDTDFVIERGLRIAQLVVAKHEHVSWQPVASLDETARAAGGFGSTGERS